MKNLSERVPINIGFPKNGNMRRDCQPLAEALELESAKVPGTLRSRFLPEALVYERRVEDIASMLKRGVYQLGVIGDDTACENDSESGFSPEILRQAMALEDISRRSLLQIPLQPFFISPSNRISRFNLGTDEAPARSDMVFFTRPELAEAAEGFPYQLLTPAAMPGDIRRNYAQRFVATSYPKLAAKALRIGSRFTPAVMPYSGQIESIVAAGDDKNVVAGFDVSRTGKSIREAGLVSFGSVMESRPGLWKAPNLEFQVFPFTGKPSAQFSDTVEALKDRLGGFV